MEKQRKKERAPGSAFTGLETSCWCRVPAKHSRETAAELRPGESETSALVRRDGAKTGRAGTTAPGRRDGKGCRGTTAKK